MRIDAAHAPALSNGTPSGVESQIRTEVAALSSSIAALFSMLPNGGRRAPDLVKALGIDNPLACRVLRVAHAADPAEAVEFLPTVNQIKRVVDLAAERSPGVEAQTAQAAVLKFERVVDELGIDQKGFESLVSALSPRGVRRVEMAHRRAAYRANAHMWGVSTECMAMVMILIPDATGEKLDLHAVSGFVGARITRPNARVMFAARTRPDNISPDEMIHSAAGKELLGKDLPAATLLTEFSTLRGAALREVQYAGFRGTRVDFKGVRPSDAENIFIHRHVRGVVAVNSDEFAKANSMVSWPAMMLHKDLILPAGYTDPTTLSHRAFARREDPKAVFELDLEDQTPLLEEPQAFVGVTSAPSSANVPRVSEIVEWIFDRHGARGMRMDVYRSEIEFPMMHSMINLQVRHIPRTAK